MAKNNNDFRKGRLTEQVYQHEERLNKIDTVLEKIRNRLPVWATLAFMVLVGFLGWLLRAALK